MTTPNSTSTEITFQTIALGVILSVVMAAANIYLGLKVGMTVAASIPAAVVAMGIFKGILRKKSAILEANMVQTTASSGESLAAGIIFTMPALVIVGIWTTFDFWTTTLVALTGGTLGVLFMIPMRKVFVVGSPELKFPEGIACAEVLRAGEGGTTEEASHKAGLIFKSTIFGASFKFLGSFLGLFSSTVEYARYIGSRIFVMGMDISPALVAVGYIVELDVAIQIFLGGCIGWLIAIPLVPVDPSVGPAIDAAWQIAGSKVRYLGVGAMIVGGLISIVRVRKSLVEAVREMAAIFRSKETAEEKPYTERDMSSKAILVFSTLTVLAIGMIYYHLLGHVSITIFTTLIMIVVAFFLTAVASYIVGLVGSSNSPVSGMTITAVLLTGILLYLFGYEGTEGIIAVLGVAGVVCCVCCTSGDVCNDLKTGHLVGASPRNQQWMEILGVAVASLIMAPVLVAMHEGSINNGTGGIGGKEFPAPQAKLFASLAQGFFGGDALPWNWIMAGAAIGILILIADKIIKGFGSQFSLHVMPVAVGIYLPLGLSVPILIGGLVHFIAKRRANKVENGILVASGVIAGESLIGVIIATLAYFNFTSHHYGEVVSEQILSFVSMAALGGFAAWLYSSTKSK
ncbi:MAG: oligopeptide transporter, OPT family [Bdellovibrionales bacterium]|nr:oligopeptide transporter, OPT family [Bdellovibrionales bacterium]